MGTALPLAAEIHAAATHGQYCPKMCTFACPVAEATGRDDAVPWSFHREVADLGDGRQSATDVGERLDLCNGCLACRDACTYEQDVPAQVVAARTAIASGDLLSDAARRYVTNVRDGLGRDGQPLPPLPHSEDEPTLAFVVGQDETAPALEALRTLATRAGITTRFVRGGAAAAARLEALGLAPEAEAARAELHATLGDVTTVVVVDPELLQTVTIVAAEAVSVLDLGTWAHQRLEAGNLKRSSAPALGAVTFHDPPALARRGGSTTAPRQVLRLLGGVIHEPEGHGPKTVSAGPGLAMEILAPEATAAVARLRAGHLAATGAPVVSTGAAEIEALRGAGLHVTDLAVLLADRTQPLTPQPPPPGAHPAPTPVPASADDASEETA